MKKKNFGNKNDFFENQHKQHKNIKKWFKALIDNGLRVYVFFMFFFMFFAFFLIIDRQWFAGLCFLCFFMFLPKH